MENLRADVTEFVKGMIITILGFFGQKDVELTEDQIAGIQKFVDLIFVI